MIFEKKRLLVLDVRMRGITLKKRSVVMIFAAAAAIIAGTTISGCSLSEQTYRVPVYSADSDGSVGLLTYTANGNDIVVTDYTLAQIGIVVPDEIDGKRVAEIADSAVSTSDATASVVIMRDSDEKNDYDLRAGYHVVQNYFDDVDVCFLNAEYIYDEKEDGELVITGWSISPETLSWPEGVTEIGSYAFSGENISELSIPSTVTKIGAHAFYNCTELKEIYIAGDNGAAGKADLSSVREIGDWAFGGCEKLTDVKLSDSLIKIGTGAFSRCSDISAIDIPVSVESIGEYAFNRCSSLESINIADDNKVYTDDDGVLYNKSMTEILKFPEGKPGDYKIPDGVQTIGTSALSCENRLEIPKSIKYIGNRALYGRAYYGDNIPRGVVDMDLPIFSDNMSSDCVILDARY